MVDNKTTSLQWSQKTFSGNARPVGNLINTCGTACMMPGYLTARASSCDGLSGGFRCKCIKQLTLALYRAIKLVHLHIFQRGILDTQKPGMPMKHHPLWVARAEDPVRV
jgi:hypothetical protein